MTLTLGSFFAGIGGFELSGIEAGIVPMWSNEIDPYCCAVLRKNFIHEIIQKDIRKIKALPRVDIVSGGFPCQPFSVAGKRGGTEDDRHLWPEMLRLVRQIQPSWVVGENVAGITSMDNGQVFEQILSDLENEGYAVQAFIIPASGVGACHKRERAWIVAHSNSHANRHDRNSSKPSPKGSAIEGAEEWKSQQKKFFNQGLYSIQDDATYSPSLRLQRQRKFVQSLYTEKNTSRQGGKSFHDLLTTTESPICGTNDGISSRMDRTGKISLKKKKQTKGDQYRLKALGNAIVPQVAYQIFKAILKFENYDSNSSSPNGHQKSLATMD